MNITKNSYESNSLLCVKKKHILIGMIIIIVIVIYNVSSWISFPSYFVYTDQLNRSIEINTTWQVLSSTRKIETNLCGNSSSCEQIRCVVILRSHGGRLGNRMFIFASAYGLARTHHCRLHVSRIIRQELENYFQMQSIDPNIWLDENALKDLKNIEIKDSVCTYRTDLLRINAFQTIELSGYWQSYLHFDAYREEIREIFIGHQSTLTRLGGYFTEISKKLSLTFPSGTHRELRENFRTRFNITWIGIHIRRTDFLGLGYSSNDQYISRAMNIYRHRYGQKNIRFLVASDDRPYCHRILSNEIRSGEVFILPNHFTVIDDLIALSLCHHSIITGGTFGFWAGYLTGGEVIHDVKYKCGCTRVEYYPPWFLLLGTLPEEENKKS